MEYHQDQLSKCCRICGRRLHKANKHSTYKHSTSYSCDNHALKLLTMFGVNVHRTSLKSTHYASANCHAILQKSSKQEVYSPVSRIEPFQWSLHKETECSVRLLHNRYIWYYNRSAITFPCCPHLAEPSSQNIVLEDQQYP